MQAHLKDNQVTVETLEKFNTVESYEVEKKAEEWSSC